MGFWTLYLLLPGEVESSLVFIAQAVTEQNARALAQLQGVFDTAGYVSAADALACGMFTGLPSAMESAGNYTHNAGLLLLQDGRQISGPAFPWTIGEVGYPDFEL